MKPGKIIFFLTSILLFTSSIEAQTVYGQIINSENNEPLPGANITITPGYMGTISSDKGFYLLTNLKPGKYTIQCSFVGFQPMQQSFNLGEDSIMLNFYLYPDYQKIDEVIIKGEITVPVKRAGDALFTGSALTSEGISLLGSSAVNSVFKSLEIMPGISVESNDPYGLADKTVRIRGIRSTFSGMTIEGFPNYGIMPIGARDDIYDMENINSVSIYKGAAPADLGTATGSKGGVIGLKYIRPADSLRIQLKQSIGSSNYYRSFVRVDLGQLTDKTKAFISGSRTKTDKWKGPGRLGPRYNVSFGITQSFGDLAVEVFTNFNTIERHHFKELTYGEAKNISENYRNDYSRVLTGNPDQDINYFEYNQGEYTNRDLMLIFSQKLSPMARLNIKAYYSSEDADYYESTKRGSNNFVLNRVRDIYRTGFIPEIKGRFKTMDYSLGYWIESADNQANVYNFRIAPNGLQPTGYSFFTVNQDNSKIHSPYFKLSYIRNKFKIQGGIKYFYYQEPSADRYTSVSPTELSDTPDPNLSTKGLEYHAFLPSLGIGYDFSKKFQTYINYGKNYMRPYMYSPIISLYANNINIFTQNDMTLQNIFNAWEMETSDNFDLGLRYFSNKISISSSLFYARHYDVLSSAYDPKVMLNYFQNVGNLTSYGADAECYLKPISSLIFFFNPTYHSMSYNKDLVRDGQSVQIKGNQSPATPEFSFKTGAILTTKNFGSSLLVRHTGKRYGDATNTEKIDASTIADINFNYTINSFLSFSSLQTSIELKNIFDTHYIGAIVASDDNNQGDATYFAGPPCTFIGSISINF